MPSASRLITPPQEAALFECFQEATRLVPFELRCQCILIGGAATIAHSSRLWTDDVDVAAAPEALFRFQEAVRAGARKFKMRACAAIEFHSSQDTIVPFEGLRLGGDCVESIAVVEPFRHGFVASPADLLLLRAETVVGRGNDGDLADFRWLLETTVEKRAILPEVGPQRLEVLVEAGRVALTLSERYVLLALLTMSNLNEVSSTYVEINSGVLQFIS